MLRLIQPPPIFWELDPLFQMPEAFSLSHPVRKCGLRGVGDREPRMYHVLRASPQLFLNVHGFGPRSLERTIRMLSLQGLRFGMRHDAETMERIAAFEVEQLRKTDPDRKRLEGRMRPLFWSLCHVDMTAHGQGALERAGFRHVFELVRRSEGDLRAIQGVSHDSIRRIKAWVRHHTDLELGTTFVPETQAWIDSFREQQAAAKERTARRVAVLSR